MLSFPDVGDEPGRINWTRSAPTLQTMPQVNAKLLFSSSSWEHLLIQVPRSHIVVPCMNSNRIYIVEVNDTDMKIVKVGWMIHCMKNSFKIFQILKLNQFKNLTKCNTKFELIFWKFSNKIFYNVKTIDSELLKHYDMSCPYAVHVLPIKGAPVHIATMGDNYGHGKGTNRN